MVSVSADTAPPQQRAAPVIPGRWAAEPDARIRGRAGTRRDCRIDNQIQRATAHQAGSDPNGKPSTVTDDTSQRAPSSDNAKYSFTPVSIRCPGTNTGGTGGGSVRSPSTAANRIWRRATLFRFMTHAPFPCRTLRTVSGGIPACNAVSRSRAIRLPGSQRNAASRAIPARGPSPLIYAPKPTTPRASPRHGSGKLRATSG